jgi:hypothetical protein
MKYAIITSTYSKFLKAGASYGEAMQAVCADMGDTPCPDLLAELAATHAKHYTCNVSWSSAGNAIFFDGDKSSRETQRRDALMSWNRNVMAFFTGKAKTVNKVDPVKAVLAKFNALTKAEQKRFFASL